MFINSLVILLDSIPFIYSNDNTLSSFMSNTCDLRILLCNTLRRIDHYDNNIRTFYSSYCTDHTVSLNFLFHFTFTAKSGCINKNIIFTLPLHSGVYCISCSSGNVGNDHTVFSQKFIYQRGFTYIWFTYNSNSRDLIILICIRILRKMFDHFIEHISQSHTVCCRNRHRLTDTKIVELINIHHKFLNTVYLIYNKNNRFSAAAEHICNFCIGINQSLMNICNKDDNIRCFNGNLRLFSHLR